MGRHDQHPFIEDESDDIDYGVLAGTVDSMREVVRVFVAALVDDGFTDREARLIVAGLLGAKVKEPEANGD